MSNQSEVLNGLSALGNKLNNSAVTGKQISVGQILSIPLDKIEIEEQVRTDFDGIEELAASIKLEGQRMPLEIARLNDSNKYLLITGERRYWALTQIGSKTAKAIVVEMPTDKKARITAQITENLQRKDLSALELSRAFVALQELGLTQNEIAERVNKSQAVISRHLAINDYADPLKQVLEDGVSTDLTLLSLLNQLYGLDKEVYAQAEEQLRNERLSRDDVKILIDRIKNKNKVKRKPKKEASKREVNTYHYGRDSVSISPAEFRPTVEAKMIDGSKVEGVLRIDLKVQDSDDMLWIESTKNKRLIAVDAKTIRIK